MVYYQNKPLSGTLYSNDEEMINNACQCILKATYKNGKKQGLTKKWYSTGNKKYKGEFLDGKKVDKHTYWNSNGKIEREEMYNDGSLIALKEYYVTGKLKKHTNYNLTTANEVISEKVFFKDGILKTEAHFKNNKQDSIYLENLSNGKPSKKLRYKNGEIIEKYIYNKKNILLESLEQTTLSNIQKTTLFYDNGKTKIKGFYKKPFIKDSIWLTFTITGNKDTEKAYKNGKLTREGLYKDNKKEGIWKFYFENNIQKNTTYKNGEKIKSETFNTTKTLKNNFNADEDVAILEYTTDTGNKQIITLTSDTPFTTNQTYQFVLGTIARSFLQRMTMLRYSDLKENTVISKKIHISNIQVRYTSENIIGNISKQNITTYNAFISFDLLMTTVDEKIIFKKHYNFNKSEKLLNAILNSATEAYATSKPIAFKSALKSIKFKKLLKKHFPKTK